MSQPSWVWCSLLSHVTFSTPHPSSFLFVLLPNSDFSFGQQTDGYQPVVTVWREVKASALAWRRSIFLAQTAPEIGPVFVRRSTANSPPVLPLLLPVTLVASGVPAPERRVCYAVGETHLTYLGLLEMSWRHVYPPKFGGWELEPLLCSGFWCFMKE